MNTTFTARPPADATATAFDSSVAPADNLRLMLVDPSTAARRLSTWFDTRSPNDGSSQLLRDAALRWLAIVLARLGPLEPGRLRQFLERQWRADAPERLIAEYDSDQRVTAAFAMGRSSPSLKEEGNHHGDATPWMARPMARATLASSNGFSQRTTSLNRGGIIEAS